MAKERNEVFFLEHNIFDSLGKDKILHFKKLWRSERLDYEDKQVIWNWVDAFIYLGDKYAKAVSKWIYYWICNSNKFRNKLINLKVINL